MYQSALDHSQLVIRIGFRTLHLGNVLVLQPIKVFVAAALPAAIGIGKVGPKTSVQINGLAISKIFAVDHLQCLDP